MPRIAENGFSVPLLLEEITGSHIAAFGWLNVVISAAVLFFFVFAERIKKLSAKLWLHVVGTLIVNVSLRWTLFLYLREVVEERRKRTRREGGELH